MGSETSTSGIIRSPFSKLRTTRSTLLCLTTPEIRFGSGEGSPVAGISRYPFEMTGKSAFG